MSGTYDTTSTIEFDPNQSSGAGTPSTKQVFGLTDTDNPISYTFTFKDTATPTVLSQGTFATADGNGYSANLARTWYGYLASDIESISVSITNGNNDTYMWTTNDFATGLGSAALYAGTYDSQTGFTGANTGYQASFWFDQDITLAAPSRAIFDLDNSIGGSFKGVDYGYIGAGNPNYDQNGLVPLDFEALGFIGQYQSDTIADWSVETQTTSFTITSSVPEPSRTLLLMTGIIILGVRRKRL